MISDLQFSGFKFSNVFTPVESVTLRLLFGVFFARTRKLLLILFAILTSDDI